MLADFFKNFDCIFKGISNISHEGMRVVWYGVYTEIAGIIMAVFGFHALGGIVFFAGLLVSAFAGYFFRDPERRTDFKEDEIVSPADGRVMSVRTEDDPNVQVVRIFLSIFDVHVQRAAISGKIGEIKHTRGSFRAAYDNDAKHNERKLIPVSNGARFAHVEQITGAIARRIVAWVKPGEEVKAGQRIGLIYFGSQVAVYLPKDARVIVSPGQKVEAGLTVIGLWTK